MFYWCLLSSPCCVLLVFVVAPFLHSIDVCCGPLLHSICACCHPSATLYWCSSWPLCCTLLVFIITPLLCFFGVCWRPLATFYWCLLAPPCCALLVPLWLILLINIPLLCSLVPFSRVLLVLFGIPNWYFLIAFFFTSMQVWKFRLIS